MKRLLSGLFFSFGGGLVVVMLVLVGCGLIAKRRNIGVLISLVLKILARGVCLIWSIRLNTPSQGGNSCGDFP